MSKVVVQITGEGEYRQAQPPQVGVAAGNEIEFVNVAGAGTSLILTPETESILSPKPSSPVEIAAGASVTYTFLQPTGGGYVAQVLAGGETSSPVSGGGADGPVLTILPSIDRSPGVRTGG